MAKGINKVILIGNLGAKPEIHHNQSGSVITNISIATTDTWRDKHTGDQQERTEWHRVVFFSRLAEIAAEYLKKGSKVYVEGSLRTRKWTDKNGIERYTTEIVGNEMQMLDKRGTNSGGEGYDHATHGATAGTSSQTAPKQAKQSQSAGSTTDYQQNADDEDIPF